MSTVSKISQESFLLLFFLLKGWGQISSHFAYFLGPLADADSSAQLNNNDCVCLAMQRVSSPCSYPTRGRAGRHPSWNSLVTGGLLFSLPPQNRTRGSMIGVERKRGEECCMPSPCLKRTTSQNKFLIHATNKQHPLMLFLTQPLCFSNRHFTTRFNHIWPQGSNNCWASIFASELSVA